MQDVKDTFSLPMTEYNGTVIKSEDLFKQSSSIQILHEKDVYVLRITKGNKLILTK